MKQLRNGDGLKMKEYKYKSEWFLIEDTNACEIKVSDKVNTVSVTLNSGGPSMYKVYSVKGGWWWHTNTVQESIARACRELIDHRSTPSSEVACEDLHKFVESLPA